MKKYLLSVLSTATMVVLLFGIHHICVAIQYDAIVVDDTTHDGISDVQVTWDFPDSLYVSFTNDSGWAYFEYLGDSGRTTVSIDKHGYYSVRPPSGEINSTTRKYRYPFTMLPDSTH